MLLKAENLALRYPNGALGIEDVSIEIDEGQIVALIGANASSSSVSRRFPSAIRSFLTSACVSISSLPGCIGLAPSGTR